MIRVDAEVTGRGRWKDLRWRNVWIDESTSQLVGHLRVMPGDPPLLEWNPNTLPHPVPAGSVFDSAAKCCDALAASGWTPPGEPARSCP